MEAVDIPSIPSRSLHTVPAAWKALPAQLYQGHPTYPPRPVSAAATSAQDFLLTPSCVWLIPPSGIQSPFRFTSEGMNFALLLLCFSYTLPDGKLLEEMECTLFHLCCFPEHLQELLAEVNRINPRNPSLAAASATLHLYKCALFYKIFKI